MLTRLFSRLSILQILTIVSALAVILALARVLHHRGENVFVDFDDYLYSFNIAFPPLIILLCTYFVAFVLGRKISDIPTDVIKILKNRYFQSEGLMSAGILVASVACLIAFNYTERRPPPFYQIFVSSLLSGEIDNFDESRRILKIVNDKNPTLAEHFSLAIQVFDLRRQVNNELHSSALVKARLLVRALSSDSSTGWNNHPLRKHSLAESYSLLGQAMQEFQSNEAALTSIKLNPEVMLSNSILLYKEVASSRSPRLVTDQLRASALNNIGNSYYYMGKLQQAIDAWSYATTIDPRFKNVGTLGNIVAALVLLQRYDEAVTFGNESLVWAEENGKALRDTSHFVGILVNTGFALTELNRMKEAIPYFHNAAMLQDDNNANLNLALAHAMSGNSNESEFFLRKISSPVKYSEIFLQTLNSEQRCSYLLWALHSPLTDSRDVAARLFVFLGERHSIDEIEAYVELDKLYALRKRVSEWLPHFPGSCSSLGHFRTVVAFVIGEQQTKVN